MQHWLFTGPAEVLTPTRRALWGVAWWGLPFFLLWSFAFPLYAGEPITLADVAVNFSLSLVFGAIFGIVFCWFAARMDRSPRHD